MTIYQPRIDNFSSWDLNVDDLLSWAEIELKPRAALAFAGEGDFNPGTHCQFCKAKAVCKANADYNLEIARHDLQNLIFSLMKKSQAFSNALHYLPNGFQVLLSTH
jgi:hypothetical protein